MAIRFIPHLPTLVIVCEPLHLINLDQFNMWIIAVLHNYKGLYLITSKDGGYVL